MKTQETYIKIFEINKILIDNQLEIETLIKQGVPADDVKIIKLKNKRKLEIDKSSLLEYSIPSDKRVNKLDLLLMEYEYFKNKKLLNTTNVSIK